jgi:hypothetical protein
MTLNRFFPHAAAVPWDFEQVNQNLCRHPLLFRFFTCIASQLLSSPLHSSGFSWGLF